MSKLGLVVLLLLLAHIMALQVQVMAIESTEPPLPAGAHTLDYLKPQKGVQIHEIEDLHHHPVSGGATESSSSEEGEGEEYNKEAEAPISHIRKFGKHHHHSSDKSVAGGGVIIGGLVIAIFAAVFCYIRVTRKRGVY